MGWAQTYLKKAGLLISTKRGYFQITPRGIEILSTNPTEINVKFLRQFDEFLAFRAKSRKEDGNDDIEADPIEQGTPEEELEQAFQKLNESLAAELLQTVKDCSPAFFERLAMEHHSDRAGKPNRYELFVH